jgi:hypothetical protein
MLVGICAFCASAKGTDMATEPKLRRTQEERSAHTREALINAAIEVVCVRLCRRQHGHCRCRRRQPGRDPAPIRHPRGLMAEVVAVVYQREVEIYAHYLKVQSFGHCIYDWPKILFDVLGRPSGIAVLEILIAAQSDSELDQSVRLRQAEVEEASLETVQTNLGGDRRTALAVKRLMVWAVRGLLMAKRIMPGDIDIGSSIELLSGLLKMAAPSGRVEELERFSPRGENLDQSLPDQARN